MQIPLFYSVVSIILIKLLAKFIYFKHTINSFNNSFKYVVNFTVISFVMSAKKYYNLPKAILVGAEFDGLRIQTEFYAKQLKDAGVDVSCYRYKGMTHAFIDKLGFVPQAEDLASIIAEAIIKL